MKTPRDSSSILDDDVGAEAQEDTSDDPKLPEHDECTTNASWSHLCGVDGYGSVLRSDADAHDEACGEELLPGLRKGRSNWSGGEAESGHKDLATATKVVVEGINDESATVRYC